MATISEKLVEIAGLRFGKSQKWGYKIKREHLLGLAKKPTLNDKSLDPISKNLLKLGYNLIDLGVDFAIVDRKNLNKLRQVPQKIMSEYVPALKDRKTEKKKEKAPAKKDIIKKKSVKLKRPKKK